VHVSTSPSYVLPPSTSVQSPLGIFVSLRQLQSAHALLLQQHGALQAEHSALQREMQSIELSNQQLMADKLLAEAHAREAEVAAGACEAERLALKEQVQVYAEALLQQQHAVAEVAQLRKTCSRRGEALKQVCSSRQHAFRRRLADAVQDSRGVLLCDMTPTETDCPEPQACASFTRTDLSERSSVNTEDSLSPSAAPQPDDDDDGGGGGGGGIWCRWPQDEVQMPTDAHSMEGSSSSSSEDEAEAAPAYEGGECGEACASEVQASAGHDDATGSCGARETQGGNHPPEESAHRKSPGAQRSPASDTGSTQHASHQKVGAEALKYLHRGSILSAEKRQH